MICIAKMHASKILELPCELQLTLKNTQRILSEIAEMSVGEVLWCDRSHKRCGDAISTSYRSSLARERERESEHY